MNVFGQAVFKVMLVALVFSGHPAFADQVDNPVDEFRKLFRQKRVEQLSAIQHLLKLEPEKQGKLLKSMLEQIMSIMLKAKTHLESSGYVSGISEFPEDDQQRHAIALIMENTCFFSDILLRFPDFVHAHLNANREWDILYKWGLAFMVESDLKDSITDKLIDLACQEVGVKEKDPDYVNPYKIEKKKPKQKKFEELASTKKTKKKERKKLKRGPRLSNSGEL